MCAKQDGKGIPKSETWDEVISWVSEDVCKTLSFYFVS